MSRSKEYPRKHAAKHIIERIGMEAELAADTVVLRKRLGLPFRNIGTIVCQPHLRWDAQWLAGKDKA